MVTLAIFWLIWCSLHSLLISKTAHTVASKLFPRYYSGYRLFYVFFSLVSLAPVLWYQFSLPKEVIVIGNLAIWSVQSLLLAYAVFMFWAGSRVYDTSYFLGLEQWRNASFKDRKITFTFHTDGVLAHVRHPWYSGGIAFLWGIGAVTDVYLLTRIILTGYIVLGTLLEESRLKKELGFQYVEYCQAVPMLIPWKLLKPGR